MTINIRKGDAVPLDFCVIGEQKCATTWLYYNLKDNKRLLLGESKEQRLFFGMNDDFFAEVSNSSNKVCGEITPDYLTCGNLMAPRLYAHNPKMKIIVMLRDPIDRAASQFRMQKTFSGECFRVLNKMNFHEAFMQGYPKDTFHDWGVKHLGINGPLGIGSMMRRSQYAGNILEFKRLFGDKNILIILQDEVTSCPEEVLRRVSDFIGVEYWPVKSSHRIVRPLDVRVRRVDITSDDYSHLVEYLDPEKKKVERMIGRELSWLQAELQQSVKIRTSLTKGIKKCIKKLFE